MPNAFTDLLQGASNAAASNISGPVDGIAWLLRKAGLPVPKNALGSSQWMAENGLTKQPLNALAGLAGETLGLTAPIAAAAKAPQIANALSAMGENYAASQTAGRMPMAGQRGAVVWHGSPHKFDKFDASKIGAGEGAQVYGHGLYMTDTPDIAAGYAKMAPRSAVEINGQSFPFSQGANQLDSLLPTPQAALHWANGDLVAARAKISKYLADGDAAKSFYGPSGWTREETTALLGQLTRLDQSAVKFGPHGPQVYKVDLPDSHIAKMLDWDKPLSQQAHGVREAMQGTEFYKRLAGLADGPKGHLFVHPDNRTGADLYKMMADSDKQSAATLRQQGIPGIRYLDGGSRGAGSGTSNYVVFPGNEGLLKILERNGSPIK